MIKAHPGGLGAGNRRRESLRWRANSSSISIEMVSSAVPTTRRLIPPGSRPRNIRDASDVLGNCRSDAPSWADPAAGRSRRPQAAAL